METRVPIRFSTGKVLFSFFFFFLKNLACLVVFIQMNAQFASCQLSTGKGVERTLSLCSFINNVHTICASRTLGEIFTHHTIQYVRVSGAPAEW